MGTSRRVRFKTHADPLTLRAIGYAWQALQRDLRVTHQEVAAFVGVTVDDVRSFINGNLDTDDIGLWFTAVQKIAGVSAPDVTPE